MTQPNLKRRARRCRGCGTLLFASQDCTPCETATVHVITDMGATGLPGRVVYSQLLGTRPRTREKAPPRRPSAPGDPYRFTKPRPE
jgi:hypothetical protein